MSYNLDEQLIISLRDRDFSRAEDLLAQGADINAQNIREETPLHMFATNHTQHALKWLIDHGADLNIQDKLGQTPLFSAVARNELAPVDLLLAAGADSNIKNTRHISPLMQAVLGEKNKGVFSRLLEDPSLDLDAASEVGTTPVTAAAARGHIDYVEVLLTRGADPETVDYMGVGLLHAAVSSGNAQVLRAVIDNAPLLDPNYAARSGSTPVSDTQGQAEMLMPLLEIGGDPNAKSGNRFHGGVSLLMSVLAQDPQSEIPLKKKKGDDDAIQATLQQLMASMGGGDVVDEMIKKGANPLARDDNGRNCGYYIVCSGATKNFHKLVAHGFDPTRPLDPSSILPYDLLANPAVDFENSRCLELIEEWHGAGFPFKRPNWDEKIDGLWTETHQKSYQPIDGILQQYARVGFWDGITKLLDLGANVNEEGLNKSTIAHTLVEAKANGLSLSMQKALALAQKAKNIDPATKEQQLNEIKEEARQALSNLRENLTSKGINWQAQTEGGQTPLHIAARTNNLEWAKFLMMEAGVDPSIRDKRGLTAAGAALLEGHSEMFHVLSETALQKNINVRQDAVLSTTQAADDDFRMRAPFVRALASYDWTNEEINMRDEEGKTAIYTASGTDQHDVVRVLLRLGADPNISSHDGNTPLMEAVFGEDGEIIRMLRAAGANMSAKNNQGATVEDVANYVKSKYVHDALSSSDLKSVSDMLYVTPLSDTQKLMKERYQHEIENIVRDWNGLEPIPLPDLTEEQQEKIKEEQKNAQMARQAPSLSSAGSQGAAMTAPRSPSNPKSGP